MSLRQKYLKILSDIVPAGAVGVLLLLGSTAPGMASQHPLKAQPRAVNREPVAERLAAIREAVSDAVGPAAAGRGEQRLVWWAWRNGGGGWRNGGWRNGGWRNGGWRNGGWGNFWRNW